MKKIVTLFLGLVLLAGPQARADEGMWIPALLTQNYAEMKRLGLELSPEQLYSVNNSSMKDAIVRLGSGFCTGEIISSEGLLLTNHHCGFGAIQKLSDTENNYLEDGFWAKTNADELPAGFSVSFLQKIEDITEGALKGVTADMSFTAREEMIAKNTAEIQKSLSEDSKYEVNIKSMYSGNKYYAYVYLVFEDVRLVGTPPKSVGKYGGDTDNWMWPRHTGDFSMFRVYANKDNEPAAYSEDNVPYKPKHHLPVSMKGVDKGDFAMIWGFPGSTDRYLTSYGVKLATEKEQPMRVKLRRTRLDIFEKYQEQSEEIDLMYATKHAQVSNYWKYFIGQTRGLKRLGIYEKKKAEEQAFVEWVNKGDAARKAKYGDVIDMYESAYKIYEERSLARTHLTESLIQVEIVRHGFAFYSLLNTLQQIEAAETDEEKAKLIAQRDNIIANIQGSVDGTFKDYYQPIDVEVSEAMFEAYAKDITGDLRVPAFNSLWKKYKQDAEKMTSKLFKKSALGSKEEMMELVNSSKMTSYKKLMKDPAIELAYGVLSFYYQDLNAMLQEADQKRAEADRLYKAALFEMYPDKNFYPNANSTMRFSYGQVLDYSPGDAMLYKHYTTMAGVMEKYVPGDYEFDLPEDFRVKAKAKDYGPYAKEGEDLRICFLTNNDITGGNSGSPVINGNGELIGLAFDGNWEAMSGDIAFEPELQRTISVDIRYVLWCIDELAGAGHIVEEMTLVR
ncbi:S46 family peptidase [bacterium]|nr:S46 family peptidase [bacterium]